jgi:hypothetical protein
VSILGKASTRGRIITGMALKRIAYAILPWCLLALMLLRAAPAIAKIIQIETQTSVTVADDLVEVEVAATNKGDEPAYNVHVHLMLLGKSRTHKGKDLLGEGESLTVFFRKIPSPSKAGTYPLIARITFQDVKHHPFSAVSCSSFPIGEAVNSALECLGKAVSITRGGLLRFTIKNSGSQSRTATATLVLPEELSTPIPRRELVIEPGAEEVLLFEISNFSALVGAVYPVFCYLEHDSGDAHYTEVANSSVKIVKAENWFRRTRPVWLGLAIITGVILVACQFKRKTV